MMMMMTLKPTIVTLLATMAVTIAAAVTTTAAVTTIDGWHETVKTIFNHMVILLASRHHELALSTLATAKILGQSRSILTLGL